MRNGVTMPASSLHGARVRYTQSKSLLLFSAAVLHGSHVGTGAKAECKVTPSVTVFTFVLPEMTVKIPTIVDLLLRFSLGLGTW